LWKITFAHAVEERKKLLCMLFGTVRQPKMFGEEVLFCFKNLILWGTISCNLWNIVWTGFLRRMWGYWPLLQDVFGCEEINLFLKIYSPLHKLFIRKHLTLIVIIVEYTFRRNMGDTFEKLQSLM